MAPKLLAWPPDSSPLPTKPKGIGGEAEDRKFQGRGMLRSLRPPVSEPGAHKEESGEAATPPGVGWDGSGQSKESDQEHPGLGEGSWVAGKESCREPLWGKEGARLSSTKGLESSLQAPPRACSVAHSQLLLAEALVWLASRGRENPGDQSGGRAERKVSCSPTRTRRTRFEPCDRQGRGPRQAE